jgi:hypothetical protein
MMLKSGRIAVVSTAALTFAAATIPTKAEASAGFIPGAYGPVGYGGGGYYAGGCGCQVYAPPPCCYYGAGWGGNCGGYYGGYYGGGYRGDYGGYGGYHGY